MLKRLCFNNILLRNVSDSKPAIYRGKVKSDLHDYGIVSEQYPAYPPPLDNDEGRVRVPDNYVEGGLPILSDAVFSLIIMIYVSGAFFFVFFLFCWQRGLPQVLFSQCFQVLQHHSSSLPLNIRVGLSSHSTS